MEDIRSDIAAFLAATKDRYISGIPVPRMGSAKMAQKIYFCSLDPLSAEEHSLVTDIAVKGLKLSDSQFEILQGDPPVEGCAVVFGGKGASPHFLYTDSVRNLMLNPDRKKTFWGELKIFASRGYK